MRKRNIRLGLLALVVAASMAEAGGAVRRPPGAVRQPRGYRYRLSPFDLARRLAEPTDEQGAAINKLQAERNEEYRKEMAKVSKKLDAKFLVLVCEVVGPEMKDTFEKITAAMAERDELIEAARQEARKALEAVRAEQGFEEKTARGRYYGGYIPRRTQDVVRYYVKLTDQQRTQIDQIRRDSWTALREMMKNIPRPKDWRDADARREYSEATRKAREGLDKQTTEEMVKLLTDEQKKAYETANTAVETHDKKVKEAEEACDKKLIALLGEEKFKSLTTYTRRGGVRTQPPRRTTQF